MSKQDVIDYVMETPHNTNRAVLEGLVDTAVEESQVQADWNQNDTSAPDYIKNKPTIDTALKNPYSIKITQGAATTTYDGSEEKTITVPTTTDVNANTTARHSHSNKSILDQITKVPADYTLPTASASVLGGVKPVEKTSAMTQSVGVDANGLLYTAPGSSGGGGATITIKTWTWAEADAT